MKDIDFGVEYWIQRAHALEESLAWALGRIADGCNPQVGEIPDHDCSFESEPRYGACEFHTRYYEAWNLVESSEATLK